LKSRRITRQTTIEKLIEQNNDAIGFLAHKKIRCVRCGESVWDTLEHAARQAGYPEEEIDQLIDDLNRLG